MSIENGGAKAIVKDNAQSYEDSQQTAALLRILALGHKEIEAGRFTAASDVFAELDRVDRGESPA
jgi:hypothetical protein